MNKSMQAALVLSVMLVATLAVAIVADGSDADAEISDDASNSADGVVCTIDGTEYTSLSDAISGSTSGDTIIIEDDFTQSTPLTIDKELTIDLNGHTITSGLTGSILISVSGGGDLSITDGSDGNDGTITGTGSEYLIQTASGSNLSIDSGNFVFYDSDSNVFYMIGIQGTATIDGGFFIAGEDTDIGYAIRVYNGGDLVLNNASIESTYGGILVRSLDGQPDSTTAEIFGGTIRAYTYGFAVFGDGYTSTEDNTQSVLTVHDATVIMTNSDISESESVCFGTNATGGEYGGHTINIEGGSFTGNTGCYFPSYGVYNITGGTFDTKLYGIRIAAGMLNISDDAVITTDVISESTSLEDDSKPTGTMGALTVGKVSTGYVGDIVVNISGGTLRNTLGNAITVYDDTMGTTELEDNVISINLTGGTVTGDVEFISDDNRYNKSDSLSLTLNGGSIDGDLKMEDGMRSTIKLTSGTISGNVDGVSVEATGTVTYPDGTTTNYYNSFVLPGAPEDIDGYTFLGYSLRPDATSADYLPNKKVIASGDVIVYEVWESDEPFIPFPDDDDEYVPIPPVVYDDSGDDDTVTIVACAAAVVVAILAVFLIIEYRKR